MGSRMSGGDAWAMVDPSTNSTIECTTDWGCTTTSIRSIGTSKSRCASMTSRPLLTSVAELVVTIGPIDQVGCCIAWSGVTWASSSRVRPRNGPPLAVSTSRRTSAGPPLRRHWAIAECSESTGWIWSGPASALTSGPPTISDSLLARASVLPASSAASVGARPIEPVMPFRTTSASPAARADAASGPHTTRGSRDVGRPAWSAARPSASRSAGPASARATPTASTPSAIA